MYTPMKPLLQLRYWLNLLLRVNVTWLSHFCLSYKRHGGLCPKIHISIQNRGQFCLLFIIIQIVSSGVSIGHVYLQPITKDSSFLSLTFLSLLKTHCSTASTWTAGCWMAKETNGKGLPCSWMAKETNANMKTVMCAMAWV